MPMFLHNVSSHPMLQPYLRTTELYRVYRRKNKRRAVDLGERPSAIEFVEYYGRVFSHHDREMNAEHKLISDAVLEYNLTLSDIQGVDIFSYSDIS